MLFKLLCSLSLGILVFLLTEKAEAQEGLSYRYPQYDPVYPQYQYRPYSYDLYGPNNCNEDCNRRYYPVYAEYLLYFRRRWEGREYKVHRANSRAQELWISFGNYTMSGKVKAPKPKKNAYCCWQFKQLPKRTPYIDYKKGRQRIEYRQLSNVDRNSLHSALQAMKSSGVYDIFVSQHNGFFAQYAHGGSAFLPWHREFLFRFENALIYFGYTGPGMPYWASTLDQALPTPADSAIWTANYFGNNNGVVNTGFAAFWGSIATCLPIGPTLRRFAATGRDGNCLLMNDFDINYVFSKNCFRDIVCQNDCKFESDHAGVHNFVGGHMGDPSCAPSDPVFFLHHAFIDCIWEEFRKKHQKSNRYKEYPNPLNGDNIGAPGHGFDKPMLPFYPWLLNGHGIEKFYEAYYKCKNRPHRCRRHADCGGPLLWCHNGRCMAKVKNGGNCRGLPNVACYCPSGIPRCLLNSCSCGAIIASPSVKISPVV